MADGGTGGGGGGDGGRWIGTFVLVDRVPKPAHAHCWAVWFEKDENRAVAFSVVGAFHVSTFFVGLAPPSWVLGDRLELPPLFETKGYVADASNETGWRVIDEEKARTWLEAESVHARMVINAHRLTYPDRYEQDTTLEAALAARLDAAQP